MKRSLTIIPAVLAVALTLTGCQQAADSAETPENSGAGTIGDCIAAGAVSDAVALEGNFGEEPALSADLPLLADSVQSTKLTHGEGEEITTGADYAVSVSLFNGRSGELIAHIGETMQVDGPYHEVIGQTLRCAKVGDRTVVTMPAAELYGEGQVSASGVPGLEDGDSIVLAMDIVSKVDVLDQAEGKEISLPDGAPNVEIAETGEPTITIPKSLDAPKELTVYQMVEGEGPVVKESDTVKVHYRGIIWRTGEEFDSSWNSGGPIDFPVTGVIDGFKKALEGYTVGSRLVSVVPANDGGYGSDWLEGKGFEREDVMVFVLDILSAS